MPKKTKNKKTFLNCRDKRLEKTRATLTQYFIQQKFRIKEDTVGKFTYNWIRTRGKNQSFKAYRVKLMIVDIITVLDKIMRPITITMKRAVKMAAAKASGQIFKHKLQQPKRATPYTPREMKPIISQLLQSERQRDIQAATVLALVSVSGSRTGDTLGTYWEDALIEKREDKLFLCIPFRISKNNQIPDTAQQLTAPMGPNSIIDVQEILQNWRKQQGYPTKGPIFPPITKNETTAMTRIWDKTAKDLKLNMKIGAHSGRNNAVKMCYLAEVPETAMRSWLSWKNNSNMPGHYRGTMMETSDTGAASLLLDLGFNDEKREPILGRANRFIQTEHIPTVKEKSRNKQNNEKEKRKRTKKGKPEFKTPEIPKKQRTNCEREIPQESTVKKLVEKQEYTIKKEEPKIQVLYQRAQTGEHKTLAQIRQQAKQDCLAKYKLN